MTALAGGLIAAFISFGGWWDVSKLAGEVRDPERTLPRALVLGVSIVTVVYIAISVVFLYLVPPAQIASDKTMPSPPWRARPCSASRGSTIFTAIVIVSVPGSLAAILMALPRVYYAMARDGLFFPAFAARSTRSRGTPTRAIAIQAVLAIGAGAVTGTLRPDPRLLHGSDRGLRGADRRRGLRAPPPVRPLSPALRTPGYPVSPLLFLVPSPGA